MQDGAESRGIYNLSLYGDLEGPTQQQHLPCEGETGPDLNTPETGNVQLSCNGACHGDTEQSRPAPLPPPL